MRLFTALVPPEEAVRALRDELRAVPSGPGLRWVAPEQWHVTLGFFGEQDAAATAEWLSLRLAGMPARRLRLAGAGTFRGVLWAGLSGDELGALAVAAGPERRDDKEFHPHLTLARGRPQGGLASLVRHIEHHRGPSWLATEVVLMRSDRDAVGARYTPVERYPLVPAGRCRPDPA